MEIFERELIYLWYYFTVQLEQIFGWWVLGMVIGSAVSVFAKDFIHRMFGSLQEKRLGILGIAAAGALGIASPVCMYGTVPIADAFSQGGMRDDWLAAFMMSSVLLNPPADSLQRGAGEYRFDSADPFLFPLRSRCRSAGSPVLQKQEIFQL